MFKNCTHLEVQKKKYFSDKSNIVTFTSIDAQKAIAFPTISLDIELKVITEEEVD